MKIKAPGSSPGYCPLQFKKEINGFDGPSKS